MMLENWINKTRKYPPAHIYAGMSQTKSERSVIAICETLYRFNFGTNKNVLGELHQQWHELSVLGELRTKTDSPFKQDYVNKTVNDFEKKALKANESLHKMHNQHKDLKEYFSSWEFSTEEIQEMIKEYLIRKKLARN